MNKAIIIEGFWHVGKTSLAKHIAKKFPQYKLLPEPDHQDYNISSTDAGAWYIKQHGLREQEFFSNIKKNQPCVIERSIISTAAYSYAAQEDFAIAFQELENFSKSFQQIKGQNKPLVVFLYQKPEDILNREYDLRNQNIIEKLSNPDFVKRYDYFYRTILPFKYGITPLFILQPLQDINNDRSEATLNNIQSALTNHRLAQVNIVCMRQLNNKTEFLLLKRNNKKGGFWQTVTGGVKPNEEIYLTVARELKEELCIQVKPETILPTNYSYYFTGTEGYELNEYVFGYLLQTSDIIKISEEHTEYCFLPMEEAKERIQFETNKIALQKALMQL